MSSITKYLTYESIHCFLFVISELVFECRKNTEYRLRIHFEFKELTKKYYIVSRYSNWSNSKQVSPFRRIDDCLKEPLYLSNEYSFLSLYQNILYF